VLNEILGVFVLIVLGYTIAILIVLLLLIAVCKAIRALYRLARGRHLAAAAAPEQAQITVPVLLDLRRPAPGARGRHR
jgi:Na+-transporting methylmalonyl-CoA/oxaloacetate decarboxylase gamma subunit